MARVNKEYRNEAKERIIVAAIEIAVTKGWGAMTLEAIAQKIGVTTPALYSYFKNRDSLRDAVVDHAFQKRQTEFETALTREGTIRQILGDFAELLSLKNSPYAQILSLLPGEILLDTGQREKISHAFQVSGATLRDCLARAKGRGEIPQDVDLDKTTLFIQSVTIGLQVSVMFMGTVDARAQKDLWLDSVEKMLYICPQGGKA
ncbi:MAG: TetR/AcrR family transcriptional regulator [Methanoregula sp.]|nr:TetR/AcrR family transcriptional regulator [Methanoregula sp.]